MNARMKDSGASAAPVRSGLVYFSSVPYVSYKQRPHFMATAFANGGFDAVLWVDPYPTRLPRISDLARIGTHQAQTEKGVHPRIEVLRPLALPIEPLPMSSFVNHAFFWGVIRSRLRAFARQADHCVLGIGRPSRLAEWALARLPHERSFVDVLDNFPEFYGGLSRASMKARLRSICLKTSDVYCSSSSIAADMRQIRRDALVVLNGHALDRFPERPASAQRLCIGYVGTIAQWFDWRLVCSLARALPEATIRLIGPEFVARPADLPPNIEFLGEMPHHEVASAMREFSVGLIPFRINELTAGVDPIKFYEYRSLSIPIWSTAFGEMKSRGGAEGVTHIAETSDWRCLWNQALTTAADTEVIASFRAATSWRKRFEPVLLRARADRSHAFAELEASATSPP